MNKFICEGTEVKDKISGRTGIVIGSIAHYGVAIITDKQRTWSELPKNLEVISYKEVK